MMGLDRFYGGSADVGSPPLPNRSSSPLPRRTSHLGPGLGIRPSLTPRTSSLSLGARTSLSTASSSFQKASNGSSLKQEITPPPTAEDPIEVLANVVGKALLLGDLSDSTSNDIGHLRKPPVLAERVSFNGLSLQDFAQENIDDEPESQRGDWIDAQTVEEYNQEMHRFQDLHRSIMACDDVLKSVETSLTSFQRDLGTVSAEIETLQSRSTFLNAQLENRRIVEKLLRPAIEEITIAPIVVRTISDGPVDSDWLVAIEELEKCFRVIETKRNESAKILAISDVKPIVENLIHKALERTRDFLVSQIKGLRLPNINAQIIQQQSLLKFKDLYAFLSRHHPQLAEEIGQAYINTMRWYYLSHFTRYQQALERILLQMVDRQDAIGVDQTSHRNNPQPSKSPQISHDPLFLGRRIDILKRTSQSALTSYLASEDKQIYSIEVPFLNFNLALVDNVIFEYTFLTTFFPSLTASTLSQKFASIFAPTFALGHASTRSLIDPTYDCLGILICIRLNQIFAFKLQRRKCPVADSYINGSNMLLWPRFQLIMDMHTDSVRRATAALPSSNRTLTLTMNSSKTTNQQSTAPHHLIQRFGRLLQGILALSAEAGDDSELVGRSLNRLKGEVEAFLNRLARGMGAVKRDRFLANNWTLVSTIVGETEGKLADEMRMEFEGLRDARG